MSGHGPMGALMRALHRPVYAARLRTLVSTIGRHLKEGDRVLDVGCGNGTLGRALMDSPDCPKGVVVEGLERYKRGGEPITVHAYDGVKMPMGDGSYDVVIVADVLHHEEDELRLLRECARVSRRLVIIKDHVVRGPLAQQRVSLIDWAANAPYGVKCLYRYHTPQGWREVRQRLGMDAVEEQLSMNLYPPGVNLLFGRGLQYLVVLVKASRQ
ncbi:MAG: class I SAM-dependent methyltransferase [Phycisphaerales bacterium]